MSGRGITKRVERVWCLFPLRIALPILILNQLVSIKPFFFSCKNENVSNRLSSQRILSRIDVSNTTTQFIKISEDY